MVHSLRASATRVSTSHQSSNPSNYTCLSCRVRAQCHSVPPRRFSTNVSPAFARGASTPRDHDAAAAIKHGLSKTTNKDIDKLLTNTFSLMRMPVPNIFTFAGKGRFSASAQFNNRTFKSPQFKRADDALASVKLEVLRHIRVLVRGKSAVTKDGRTDLSSLLLIRPWVSDPGAQHGRKQRRARSIPRRPSARTGTRQEERKLQLHGLDENDSELSHELERRKAAFSDRSTPTLPDVTETKTNAGKAKAESQAPSKRSKASRSVAVPLSNAEVIRPLELDQQDLDIPTQQVPNLQYGLDRVLFNPGVYHLRDPRSRVYNFDPYLEKIVDPVNFDFASLDEYRTPSADPKLAQVATEHEVEYVSSTSAITSVLTSLHQLLSRSRPLKLDRFSGEFFAGDQGDSAPKDDFSIFNKAPTSVYLIPSENGYAIDKAEEGSWPGVLSFVGMCLEKLFTVPKEVFEWYKIGSGAEKPEDDNVNGYHYTKFGSLLVRSQLDAHDDRLPGSGIFDIKTRAVLPIRMDARGDNHEISKNYEIKKMYGRYESYERELYDMARSTMMKYSLQARLGRMDGIFVAYHNIVRMFGFQYLSLADMDYILHGQTDPALGDAEMKASLQLMTDAFDHATKLFPDEPLRLYFQVKGGSAHAHLQVVVEPVLKDEIVSKREKSKKQSKDFLQQLINVAKGSQGKGGSSIEEKSLTEEGDSVQATKDLISSDEPLSDSTTTSYLTSIQQSISSLSAEQRIEDFNDRLGHGVSQLVQLVEHLDELYSSEDESQVLERPINPADLLSEMFAMQNQLETAFYTRFPQLQIDQQSMASWKDLSQESTSEQDTARKLQSRLVRSRVVLQSLASDLSILGAPSSTSNGGQSIEAALGQNRTLGDALRSPSATKKSAAKEDIMANHPVPARLAAFTIRTQDSIDNTLLGPSEAPTNISATSDWEIHYERRDVPAENVAEMWKGTKRGILGASMGSWDDGKAMSFYNSEFFRKLMRLSRSGGEWRKEMDKEDESEGWRQVVYERRR